MTLLPFPKPGDWQFGDLDMWCHDVIVADVPVKFDLYSEKGNLKAASFQYALMTDAQLARRHSEKPTEFYDMVAAHTPGQVRCDLFSAGIIRPGFIGWGEDHRTLEAKNGTRQGALIPQSPPFI